MKKRYCIEDVENILLQNGIAVTARAKTVKGSTKERPERVIKDVAAINIPPKALHYQIRVNDHLYARIKNDDRLNIDNSVNFPLEDFYDVDGKIIQVKKMAPVMKSHFEEVYGKVVHRKKYKNNENCIDELTDNRIVYCIDHGAVEKSDLRKGKNNLVILYTAEDMDIVIEHIIDYMK